MDEHNQIEPPASFAAIYTSADGQRLVKPAAHVIARYELCEDLAQSLVDQASTLLFASGGSEAGVLARIGDGLREPGSPVTPGEAGWVLARLAELAGWPPPADTPA